MPPAAADVGAGAPLLDRGTQLAHFPGQSAFFGEQKSGPQGTGSRYFVKLWPSCKEGSITMRSSATASTPEVDPETGEVLSDVGPDTADTTRRSSSRAKASLRRYCLHNGLTHMPTLTYAYAASSVDGVANDVRLFRRKLNRQPWFAAAYPDGRWPYAWVPEEGSLRKRLHLHMAVGWWDELRCVEVCQRCARAKLREKREVPPAGSHCIGCVWGRGFVGAPSEGNGDPRKLSAYISKYVSKSFEEGRLAGQRYRVAEGFQPTPEVHGAGDLADAFRMATVTMGERPMVEALHENVRGWDGPPVWTLRWEDQ